MSKKVFDKSEITVAEYVKRNTAREDTLLTSTMNMVGYFMGLGDDQPTAQSKVSQISNDVADKLYLYVLGNTQPLIDGINSSALTFMDQAAKDYLTNQLTPSV